jgi:hypothetical protein
MFFLSVYYVGPQGWKKLSGDDVGELHYKYYPVTKNVKSNQQYAMSKRLDHMAHLMVFSLVDLDTWH